MTLLRPAVACVAILIFLMQISFANGRLPQTGLTEEMIESETEQPPVLWRDFVKAQSVAPIRPHQEDLPWPLSGQGGDHWLVRHPNFAASLLNAVGRPADIAFDPGMKQECDIYLGLRAVEPIMTFAIKLSGEAEFTTITAPTAAHRDFSFEFHWKSRVPMAGQKIIVRSLGKPVYLEYVRFVPYGKLQSARRVPREHLAILKEPGRHFAFPGVAELLNGDLLVVCREGDAHVCARGKIVMVRSQDGGKTWSPRQTLYDSPSDDRDPAILCLKDGTVIVSFTTWDSWRSDANLCKRYATETARMEKEGWGKYTGTFLIVSSDGGKSWSAPRRSPIFSPHGPVIDANGSLCWICRGTDIHGVPAVQIYRSQDLGATWHWLTDVAPDRPQEMATFFSNLTEPLVWDEPNLIFLPGQKMAATLRFDWDGYVRHVYSNDGGRSWSQPQKLPVWGFPQQFCQLADGRLLLSYGYRKEPYGIRACISSDGGKTYDLQHEIVLRHEGDGWDLGYPYSIQLRSGEVFTAYYYKQKGTCCYIEGVKYRP